MPVSTENPVTPTEAVTEPHPINRRLEKRPLPMKGCWKPGVPARTEGVPARTEAPSFTFLHPLMSVQNTLSSVSSVALLTLTCHLASACLAQLGLRVLTHP